MTICIVNGPNLNLLGKRETDIYGVKDFETYFNELKKKYPTVNLEYFQSNVEGELINYLHEKGFFADGIILNAGGYTHTSVALSDAVAAIKTPVIEVHISNIFAREDYRHVSLLSKNCKGIISGLGLDVYELAVKGFKV
jgi:3-dehydroquinate dehydratase II